MSEYVIHDDKELLKWSMCIVKHPPKWQGSVQKFFYDQLEDIQQIGPLDGHRILSWQHINQPDRLTFSVISLSVANMSHIPITLHLQHPSANHPLNSASRSTQWQHVSLDSTNEVILHWAQTVRPTQPGHPSMGMCSAYWQMLQSKWLRRV